MNAGDPAAFDWTSAKRELIPRFREIQPVAERVRADRLRTYRFDAEKALERVELWESATPAEIVDWMARQQVEAAERDEFNRHQQERKSENVAAHEEDRRFERSIDRIAYVMLGILIAVCAHVLHLF